MEGGGLSLPAPPPPVKSVHHRLSPHRMSVQVPARQRVPLGRKCKSLPNVNVVAAAGAVLWTRGRITGSSSTSHCAVTSSDKKSRPKILKKTWDRVKTIIQSPQRKGSDNNNSKACSSAPSTPSRAGVFDFDEEFDESERIKRNYALLQKRLSEELHQRMNECSRDSPRVADHLSDEFKKRLQQWEMWKASTGKVQYTSEELLQIIPVEFSKKLIEWECIRHGGVSGEQARGEINNIASGGGEKATRNKAQRNKKLDGGGVVMGGGLEDSRVQELAWLDKQLEKIDVEKKRLEREMKKYLEREARLEKMREALKHGPTTDVVIRTPTAKCRVERIDEKFAMRLYEWEEKMGVEPESSAMALLNPKYFDVKDSDQQQQGSSSSSNAVAAVVVADDDDDVVLGPLDLINARLEAADPGEDASVRRAMEHVAEALAEADGDGRISSAASSCCCSADYDDPTDSFATKNNSGASNTDSELFYKPEPRRTAARRRSSDAISTPLSDARSPSLSAFTSDDEADCGLLKTVSEEIDDGGGAATTVVNKDAESQTEVILRAKPIVVEDETIPDDDLACDNPGVFVQTKRTIFTPILGDEDDDEEEQEEDEQVLQQHSPVGRKAVLVGSISSIPSISSPPCWKKFEGDDEPECGAKVVGAIPKVGGGGVVEETSGAAGVQYKPQPKTQLHRSFPKVGKIPVWCSPLVARRQFAHTQQPQQIPIITTPDDSADFSIDKFLQESKLLDAAVNGPPPISDSLSSSVPSSFQLQPPKRITSRLPKTNPLVPRKYTIGGGFPPGGRGALLTRSNSFGFPRAEGSDEIYCGEFQRGSCSAGVGYGTAGSQASGSDVSLVRSVGEGQFEGVVQGLSREERGGGGGTLHCVTKSKSTGSIKSKFGRAIARSFGFGGGSSRSAAAGGDARDQNQNNNDGQQQVDAVVADRRGSGSSRLRRFGSWIPRVGGGSKTGE